MFKKIASCFLALLIMTTIPAFALPLPDGDFNRQQAINTFFKDKPENLIEGIWITDDNKYEIAIVKNDFSICPGYDYIGFTVQTTDAAWEPGKVKLQLKATAIPKVFTGLIHKKPNSYLSSTDEQSTGSTVRLLNSNILGYTTERREAKLLYRIYPGNTEATNAASRSGTGFFIASDLIITNYHVVDDCQSIDIKYSNGQKTPATVVTKDPVNDLALLRISKPESSVTPLSIAKVESIKDGDAVYTIGFPMPGLLGTKAKLSEGIINSTTGYQDDVRMFQISIPIQPGNSGGPLLNSRGQVVGVVTATVNPSMSLLLTGALPQNVSFAMKINYVNNLIASLPEDIHLSTKNTAYELSPAQIMTSAKDAIVQIEAR